MKTQQLALGLGALGLLLTGCASGDGSGAAAAAGTSMPSGHMMGATSMPGHAMPGDATAGTSTPSGQTMADASSPAAARQPSSAALMICSQDLRDQVRTVLKLSAPAPARSTWQDPVYTCTYTLPMGTMVLSVRESASKPAARDHFQALRTRLGATQALLGLGEQAYATRTGIAVVVKDDMTLQVDTTRLPAVFGPERQRRTDLAYEIASAVLGCWVAHH